MAIPNDPVMLLSYINTQLRDFYPSLDELTASLNIDINDLKSKLALIGYEYNPELNKFV